MIEVDVYLDIVGPAPVDSLASIHAAIVGAGSGRTPRVGERPDIVGLLAQRLSARRRA